MYPIGIKQIRDKYTYNWVVTSTTSRKVAYSSLPSSNSLIKQKLHNKLYILYSILVNYEEKCRGVLIIRFRADFPPIPLNGCCTFTVMVDISTTLCNNVSVRPWRLLISYGSNICMF